MLGKSSKHVMKKDLEMAASFKGTNLCALLSPEISGSMFNKVLPPSKNKCLKFDKKWMYLYMKHV